MVGGGQKIHLFFSPGDGTIPRDGQVKKLSSTPPTIFSFGQNIKDMKTLNTRQKKMKIIENAKYTWNNVFRN